MAAKMPQRDTSGAFCQESKANLKLNTIKPYKNYYTRRKRNKKDILSDFVVLIADKHTTLGV
jgi:hypothetical protein